MGNWKELFEWRVYATWAQPDFLIPWRSMAGRFFRQVFFTIAVDGAARWNRNFQKCLPQRLKRKRGEKKPKYFARIARESLNTSKMENANLKMCCNFQPLACTSSKLAIDLCRCNSRVLGLISTPDKAFFSTLARKLLTWAKSRLTFQKNFFMLFLHF